jgi:hypothetical protein
MAGWGSAKNARSLMLGEQDMKTTSITEPTTRKGTRTRNALLTGSFALRNEDHEAMVIQPPMTQLLGPSKMESLLEASARCAEQKRMFMLITMTIQNLSKSCGFARHTTELDTIF